MSGSNFHIDVAITTQLYCPRYDHTGPADLYHWFKSSPLTSNNFHISFDHAPSNSKASQTIIALADYVTQPVELTHETMPGKARDQFRYKRLKRGEIRLLELDYNHNSLTGTLQHWKVECDHPGDANMHDGETCVEIPEYMALSHHWDPRPDSEDDLPALLVHNIAYQNELSELKLRPTLHAALLAIREQMIERSDWKCKLWVDAICIDQNDDDDKDRQLGKMGDIYNDARRVIVWLGTLDPDTKRGLEFVEKLQQRRILRESLSTDSNQYSEDWKCLGLLTRKPWFQRLWIVQGKLLHRPGQNVTCSPGSKECYSD